MASNHDRIERWIDNAMGWNDRALGERGTVYYRGDSIYSYGPHFEMARVLRAANGDPRAVWINGDTYSTTTSGHQSGVRGAVGRACLPTFIIPAAALRAARINVEDIEPLDIRPDRQEAIHHTAQTVTGAPLHMDDPEGRTEMRDEWHWEGTSYEHGPVECVIRIPDPNRRYLSEASNRVAEWNEESRNWCWTTYRHWLGDCLIRAKVAGRRRRFLSSFDHQEARPLYFLCELPTSSSADTVERAYQDLRPNAVLAADAAGLDVARQGDMFAIPTELSTREVKKLTPYGKGRIVKRPSGGVLGTRHSASQIVFATEGRVYARGTLYHEPEGWRPADHARRKMGDGKTWHLLTRNTVPRQAARERTTV